MARGPGVNGRQALASIKTRATQDGGLAEKAAAAAQTRALMKQPFMRRAARGAKGN